MIHFRIVLLGNQSKDIEMKIAKLVTAIALLRESRIRSAGSRRNSRRDEGPAV